MSLPSHIQLALDAAIASGETSIRSHDATWYGDAADRAGKVILWTSPQGNLAVSSFDANGNWKDTVLGGKHLSDTLGRNDSNFTQIIKDAFAADAVAKQEAADAYAALKAGEAVAAIRQMNTEAAVANPTQTWTAQTVKDELLSASDARAFQIMDAIDGRVDGRVEGFSINQRVPGAGTAGQLAGGNVDQIAQGVYGGANNHMTVEHLLSGNAGFRGFFGMTAEQGTILANGGSIEFGNAAYTKGKVFGQDEIAAIMRGLSDADSFALLDAADGLDGLYSGSRADEVVAGTNLTAAQVANMNIDSSAETYLLGNLGEDQFVATLEKLCKTDFSDAEITLIGQNIDFISLVPVGA